MVDKLNAAGLELISPLRARRVHSETDYIEGLCTYTRNLLVKINHRFNKDTELLATMLPFDEEAWQECIPIVAAQLGFDRGRLCDEGNNVKRHCENYRALSDRNGGEFSDEILIRFIHEGNVSRTLLACSNATHDAFGKLLRREVFFLHDQDCM